MQTAEWWPRSLPPSMTDQITLAESIRLIRRGTWARVGFSALCAIIAVPHAPAAFLAAWIIFILTWELAVRPALEDRIAGAARDEEAGFRTLALANFVGSVAYCAFPVVVWSSGETVALLLAVAWVCGSAAHDFVYFAARPVLLLSCLAPLVSVAIAAPFSGVVTLSPLTLVGITAMVCMVLVGGLAGFDRREHLRALAESAAARQAAEGANAAKSRFLGLVSHELRTPLNAIIGYAEIIGEAKDRHAPDAARVLAAAHRLLHIVNCMLDVSRLEAGLAALQPTRAPVASLLGDLKRIGEPLAAARGNTFVVRAEGDLGAATLDWARLCQSLAHLIDNAAKFTKRGAIDVAATRTTRNGRDVLQFTVRDTGIGIARERQAEIFEPISQADASSARRHGGAGLGLASARLVARLMGGDVTCKSAPGEGSTFTLWVDAGDSAS